ncbi:MAG: ATP-binding cassette domain-containing protein, partial [Clostridia bacterium]|nr:ATP-binding cassette domain-containing protein [Clostridia bacterium]
RFGAQMDFKFIDARFQHPLKVPSLSGGQKQRLAIARAVLTDPAILVMDDSTSAVDMETEYLIQNDLKDVLKNRTTFIIAHRISSVKNADLILVLKDGRIVERGTHKELLSMEGEYYNMVQDQYKDLKTVMAKGGAL